MEQGKEEICGQKTKATNTHFSPEKLNVNVWEKIGWHLKWVAAGLRERVWGWGIW